MRGHAVVELEMQYQQTHPVGESERRCFNGTTRAGGDVGFWDACGEMERFGSLFKKFVGSTIEVQYLIEIAGRVVPEWPGWFQLVPEA